MPRVNKSYSLVEPFNIQEILLMRILLADEGTMARFALGALLEQRPGWTVVGEVVSADKLLPKIEATNPDLVLLNWNLPDLIADELLPIIATKFPDLSVIVLSGRPETRLQAIAAGANAFVSKADPPDRFLEAVSTVKRLSDSSDK
jgi:DNA-binding NarL/FixJ family response regulator